MSPVKFDPVGGYLVKIPVVINGTIHTSFLLDTGAGVNLISERLCKQIGCNKEGSYSGKRMSGEEVTVAFAKVDRISIGDFESCDIRAGVSDIFEKIPKELGNIDGAVSLRFFEDQPFTIDYVASTIEIGRVESRIHGVPLQLERDHEKTIAFVAMENLGQFEVDTGASLAVLNLPQIEKFKIDLSSSSVKKVEGKNETGFPFVSYYTLIPELKTAVGEIKQENPKVVFKNLIHDGVIGNDFFKGRRVTFDLKNLMFYFQ